MKIRGFRVPRVDAEPTLVEKRLVSNQGDFDREIATVLAVLSTWTYADPEEFATSILRTGLPGSQCAVLTLANDAMLLDTCASIIQSWDKRVVILCLRGTPPRSTIAWTSNMAVDLTPFHAGSVHSGFYSSLVAMWPSIAKLLHHCLAGTDLCTAVELVSEQDGVKECGSRSPERGSATMLHDMMPSREAPVLYIAGHSLGGALATLSAALLFTWDGTLNANEMLEDFVRYKELLRGVYTFGAPMVGNPFFAEVHEKKFGSLLFRMVNEQDFVPQLPNRAMGNYKHFGIAYHATEAGWVRQPPGVRKVSVKSVVQEATVAVLAVLSKVFPFVKWLSAIQILDFDEHLPIRYVRISLRSRPFAELLLDYRTTLRPETIHRESGTRGEAPRGPARSNAPEPEEPSAPEPEWPDAPEPEEPDAPGPEGPDAPEPDRTHPRYALR
ncbi:lipase family protein [Sorangium sp. So ce134]